VSGLEPGSALGGYKILARVRAGAMGVLYLARRRGPGAFARPVAIKVIHEHLAQNKRFCRMFIAEAKLSARIDDPHVVRTEAFGEVDGRYYLVMDFVHGASLAQALGVLRGRGGLPMDVAVAIAMDVASGLHAAHEATDGEGAPLGIVHRDVSPQNVLVSYKGYVKVIDFGIAKAKEGAGETATGSLRGKLAYMPPEQARSAKHVDRRADLYALGLVLWEMLAGRRMFDGKNEIEILNQILNPIIIPPSNVNERVPKALDKVVLELLQEDPESRPPNGATVASMLAAAWPPATKVLPADIAAVMREVREAATSAPGDEHDPSAIYAAEVKKGLTIFQKNTVESIEDAEGEDPTAAREKTKILKPHDHTEVMSKAPVAPPSAPSMDDDSLYEATTQRSSSPTTRRHLGSGFRNAGTIVRADNPYMINSPMPEPPRVDAPPPSSLPPWLTQPVMILVPAALVVLAAVLVAAHCGSRHGDPASDTATESKDPR
jgi:serine/threonine-protein kinase